MLNEIPLEKCAGFQRSYLSMRFYVTDLQLKPCRKGSSFREYNISQLLIAQKHETYYKHTCLSKLIQNPGLCNGYIDEGNGVSLFKAYLQI